MKLVFHKGPVDSCPACARLESIFRPLEERHSGLAGLDAIVVVPDRITTEEWSGPPLVAQGTGHGVARPGTLPPPTWDDPSLITFHKGPIPPLDGWQPIATAPRDGSTIILDLYPEEDGDSGIATGEWFQDQICKGWWVRDYLVGENEPRAWHPVPARPKPA
jgi:hypothetical protein